jgi:hypothetical protein
MDVCASPAAPFTAPYDLKPDTELTREQLAAALTAIGRPITTATLASMASRRTGPPFVTWGRRPIYTWGSALTWARGRLGAPRRRPLATAGADRVAQAPAV